MSTPLISVIVPAYNAEATILETIHSVQEQTLSDLEIVVIDDGSTDATLERLETVRDPRLRVFTYQNGGLATARNRGMGRARGELISFIDADDLWTPDKLEFQLAALRRRPRAGVAYSWTAFIDQDGRFLFAKEPLRLEGDVYAALLMSCFIARGSNVLLRRACVDSVGRFDAGLRAAEDWEYWIRAAARWPFALVPRYQVLYRLSPGGLSSQVAMVEHENAVVWERAFRDAPPALRRRRNESLANVKQYVAFLYLTRAPGWDYRRRAGDRLWESVRLHPPALLSRKTWNLLLTWLLLHLVPVELGPGVVRGLLRLHGRWTMPMAPAPRVPTIVRRW